MLYHGLYDVNQIRQVEQAALAELSEETLMKRAGQAAFDLLIECFPHCQRLIVVCGTGNNGGDGFVLAKLAAEAGLFVRVMTVGELKKQSELAKAMMQEAAIMEMEIEPFEQFKDFQDADVLVDAILGIGIRGHVRQPAKAAIELINASQLPVIAMDIPSGLNADTGIVADVAVRADMTLTFIGMKQGLVTAQGRHYAGELFVDAIGLDVALKNISPNGWLADEQFLKQTLPMPVEYCHKGMMGHVVIVGGDEGMPGAVCLAAVGALRTGAGKVTVVTREKHFAIVMAKHSEIICLPIEKDWTQLQQLLQSADVCLVGPGMTTSTWSQDALSIVEQYQGMKIIDATALRLLCLKDGRLENTIITPHPGEAAALLKSSSTEIEADRYGAVQLLYQKIADNVVLKGAGTIIRNSKQQTYVCTLGNSGLATAGTGDVLAGMLAGLAGHMRHLHEVAATGVVLHAYAADLVVEERGRLSLMASDLFSYIGLALKAIEKNDALA